MDAFFFFLSQDRPSYQQPEREILQWSDSHQKEVALGGLAHPFFHTRGARIDNSLCTESQPMTSDQMVSVSPIWQLWHVGKGPDEFAKTSVLSPHDFCLFKTGNSCTPQNLQSSNPSDLGASDPQGPEGSAQSFQRNVTVPQVSVHKIYKSHSLVRISFQSTLEIC